MGSHQLPSVETESLGIFRLGIIRIDLIAVDFDNEVCDSFRGECDVFSLIFKFVARWSIWVQTVSRLTVFDCGSGIAVQCERLLIGCGVAVEILEGMRKKKTHYLFLQWRALVGS